MVVARIRMKPLALTALLLMAGAGALCFAQSPGNGSLTGKLTDTHSIPLGGATVTLRNDSTGVEVRTTTSKAGVYRFGGLGTGEYTLVAESQRLGRGKVDGIVVAADHESRVQAAIRFEPPLPEPILIADLGTKLPEPAPSLVSESEEYPTRLFRPLANTDVPSSTTLAEDVAIATTALAEPPKIPPRPWRPDQEAPVVSPAANENPASIPPRITKQLALVAPASTLPGIATLKGNAADASHSVSSATAAVSTGDLGAVVVRIEINAILATLQNARLSLKTQLAAAQAAPQPSAGDLNSAQLQALPISGRNWQNFALDSPPSENPVEDESRSPSSRAGSSNEITVDGSPIRLAFGGAGVGRTSGRGASLIGPGVSETAIRDVQAEQGQEASYATHSAVGRSNVETQRGANRLHGQASLFDRQNTWGAQNPFTQWVRETAPASLAAVPTFTPQPYTPSDLEWTWGMGLGGAIRRNRIFWFTSFDNHRRSDAGVSTVKHRDNFFAQPSNDQMQVLSARLGLSSANPVAAGVSAYSKLLETLAGLLGPATRTTSQWTGFGRIDCKLGERQSFVFEGTGAHLSSPGGGFTRASENYGSHSFGSIGANEEWFMGRWQAFLTPNLLVVSQGSVARHIQSARPQTPSAYEETLNINAWGQLPQIVVDSRYGFTIGNPARFGSGSYPNEHLYHAREQVSWARGALLFNAGFELSHNTDATSRLRNQTGTYYYSSVENFASDALAFAAFGLNGQLDPMDQHNCDQTGKIWRDSMGTLHGLGYLPCYSYYSQTMGPAHWWLSTNDWAGYVTSQWQPLKRLVLSLAMRWERQQLPPALSSLKNQDLPLTQTLPNLGNNWGPRASLAWGSSESRWPVLRFGYGMYFGRTPNAVVETALTQTGSLNGDLNFFMRPTDNLNAGGAPPFPYVLSGEPTSLVKPGAVEFAPGFRNGEIHQAEAAVEKTLPGGLHLEAAALASLARRLPITIDTNIDPATNPKTITYAVVDGNGSGPIKTPQLTVPFYASWPSAHSSTGFAGRLYPNYQQVTELFSRANSTYEAAMLRLSRNGRGLTVRARYTYAHAMDWNPNERAQVTGSSVLDPTDFRQEYGTSNLDIRHSVSTALIWEPKWELGNRVGLLANGWMVSGIGQFHSGLPYSMRVSGSLAREFNTAGTAIVALGTGMNGYGGDNRVFGMARNTYRYPSTWKADLRLGKTFNLGHLRQLELLAESFNLFNHQNVTELETVGYSIDSGSLNGGLPRLNFLTGLKTGQSEFGKPLNINATNFYRERQIQFGARIRF